MISLPSFLSIYLERKEIFSLLRDNRTILVSKIKKIHFLNLFFHFNLTFFSGFITFTYILMDIFIECELVTHTHTYLLPTR